MKKLMIIMILVVLFLSAGLGASASGALPQVSPESTLSQGEHRADTLYGIGSVSKVFTAASVMRLADEGLVNLDESLTLYIPDFQMADERYRDITPRMLLNHSSGLMGMTDNNAFLMGDNDTYHHDNFLRLLQAQALKHPPGEVSIYCNDGYTLAEILVERVSGMSFTEFMEDRFFEPLDIHSIQTPQGDFDRGSLTPR